MKVSESLHAEPIVSMLENHSSISDDSYGMGVEKSGITSGYGKAVYIKAPFLDEQFQQHRVAQSTFSSSKRARIRTENVLPPMSVATHRGDASKDCRYFSCRMTFPVALPHKKLVNEEVSRSSADTEHVDYTEEGVSKALQAQSIVFKDALHHRIDAIFDHPQSSCQPNVYWQQPPPHFTPVPDKVTSKPKLKEDEQHPLLATDNAARTAIAQSMTAVFEASQSRVYSARPSTPSGQSIDNPVPAAYTPTMTETAALLLSNALFNSLQSHSIPSNAARSANDLRASDVLEFQPFSLNVSDIHSNSNYHNKTFNNLHNILVPPPPAFRVLSKDVRHILQVRGTKTRSKLEHHLKAHTPALKPSTRPARPVTRTEEEIEEEREEAAPSDSHVSDSEGSDSDYDNSRSGKGSKKAHKDKAGRTTNSHRNEEPKKEEVVQSSEKSKPSVRYNPSTGDWEMVVDEEREVISQKQVEEEMSDEEDPKTFSLEECLDMESSLAIWHSSVMRKREQENPNVDPNFGISPVDEVAGSFKVKVVTPQLVSLYNSESRRPGVQQYLCGRGIRMGSVLTKTQPPSSSSFTRDLPQHLKELSSTPHPSITTNVLSQSFAPSGMGIAPTPPAAFACKDDPNTFVMKDYNFATLLTDKGGEIEEIQLEGMKWLSEDSFFTIADFCPNLRLANFAGCPNISSRALSRIATACPLISYINVSNCKKIGGEALASLLQHCPQLEVLCGHGLGATPGVNPKEPREKDKAKGQSTIIEGGMLSTSQFDFSITQAIGTPNASPRKDGGGSIALEVPTTAQTTSSSASFNYTVSIPVASCPLQVLHCCRQMRVIDLSHSAFISDHALFAIATNCSALEILNVSGCSFTDMGVSAIGRKCANLRCFILSMCSQSGLTPKGLSTICNAPRNLQRLDLSGVSQLDDLTLKTLLPQIPCMKNLSLNGCPMLSDESIRLINTSCRQLRSLGVASCAKVSLQTLMDLIHDIGSLSTLVVSDCVSNAEINMLRQVRGNVRIVKNYFRPPPKLNISAFKPVEEKRKKLPPQGDAGKRKSKP